MIYLDDAERVLCNLALELHLADRVITSNMSSDDIVVAAERDSEELRERFEEVFQNWTGAQIQVLQKKLGGGS